MEGILEYGTVRLYYVVPEVGHAVSACYVHGTKEMAQRLAKVLEGRQIYRHGVLLQFLKGKQILPEGQMSIWICCAIG